MSLNENLALYESMRVVPQEAKKTIGAGRLKGMTDINPMWRIKTLTEQFGACGIGWYFETTRQWIEEVNEERVACVNINLFVKVNGEWSKPIFGTGGSKLSTVERSGVYVSDECYKMATTDAISVACKNLGMGADVYWDKDRTKYSASTPEQSEEEQDAKNTEQLAKEKITGVMTKALEARCEKEGVPVELIYSLYHVKSISDLNNLQYRNINDNWVKILEKSKS